MTIISSLQNQRVKEAIHLRDRRQRDKRRRILIDGARELARAGRAGVRLLEVFVCEPLCASPEARSVLAMLPHTGAHVLQVSEAVFAKLAFGRRAEGVIGIAEMPARSLDQLVLPEHALVGVIEAVEKPGNVGAVLRSADGAGLSALIVAQARTDLFNPNAIRASLGTIFTMPLSTATTSESLDWLRRQGLAICAARVDGSVPYTEVDYRGPTALVLGSEAAGLSDAWSAGDITSVRLPMHGLADSLNISAAAAVLFYEALRQRA